VSSTQSKTKTIINKKNMQNFIMYINIKTIYVSISCECQTSTQRHAYDDRLFCIIMEYKQMFSRFRIGHEFLSCFTKKLMNYKIIPEQLVDLTLQRHLFYELVLQMQNK